MPSLLVRLQNEDVKMHTRHISEKRLLRETDLLFGKIGRCGGSVRKSEDEVAVADEKVNGKSSYG